MPTAAALIIGNEILTGKVQETNVEALAKELFFLGVELRRVIVCPDEIDIIAADLDRLRQDHDWVITSGGVGPTHDDVTLKAVAACFGCELVRSAELEGMIRELVGDRMSDAHLRMANVPDGAELMSTPEVPWPTVVMGNVFVMPGVPRIFAMKLPLLRDRFSGGEPFLTESVYTLCSETEIAEILDHLDAKHEEVNIGSYPVFGNPGYRVKLTFDSRDREAIDAAVAELLDSIPTEQIVPAPPA